MLIGCADALCLSHDTDHSDLVHAVRATTLSTLCGAPVTYIFFDVAFPVPDLTAPVCPECTALATN